MWNVKIRLRIQFIYMKCEQILRANNVGDRLATLADGKVHAESNGGTDSTKRSTLLTDI